MATHGQSDQRSFVGVVEGLRLHRNSLGRPWAEFVLTSHHGSVAAICFPSVFGKVAHRIDEGGLVAVSGRMASEPEPRLVVHLATVFEPSRKDSP